VNLGKLSAILWEERQLLELLIFKLEEESLVVDSGRHHWLGRATSEIQFVLSNIESAEIRREELTKIVAGELALGQSPALGEIVDCCSEPWATTFYDHRKALKTLIERVLEISHKNREVLSKYVIAVTDALSIVGKAAGESSGPGYKSDGSVFGTGRTVRVLDARG
jgi:hypothetical protein